MSGEPTDLAPFKIWCDGCGTDIDDPDTDFSLGTFAVVPAVDFVLCEVTCLACDTRTDVAVWVLSKDELLANDPSAPPITPNAVALIDRYLGAVDTYRTRFTEATAARPDVSPVDFSRTTVSFHMLERQAAAVPSRILAAAQGLRLALEDAEPPAGPWMLRIGDFRVAVSIDEPESPDCPLVLHLSIGRPTRPELSKSEVFGLAALFFWTTEIPQLSITSGLQLPVLHLRVPYEPRADK